MTQLNKASNPIVVKKDDWLVTINGSQYVVLNKFSKKSGIKYSQVMAFINREYEKHRVWLAEPGKNPVSYVACSADVSAIRRLANHCLASGEYFFKTDEDFFRAKSFVSSGAPDNEYFGALLEPDTAEPEALSANGAVPGFIATAMKISKLYEDLREKDAEFHRLSKQAKEAEKEVKAIYQRLKEAAAHSSSAVPTSTAYSYLADAHGIDRPDSEVAKQLGRKATEVSRKHGWVVGRESHPAYRNGIGRYRLDALDVAWDQMNGRTN